MRTHNRITRAFFISMGTIIVAGVVFAERACGQSLPEPNPARAWAEISELVRERFHDADLNDLDWDAVTRETATAIDQRPEDGPGLIRAALRLLEDGHTKYFTPGQRAYYELLDVFNPDGLREEHPFLPQSERVRYVGVGVVAEEISGRVFASDVYPGGPADEAGVVAGDELVSANGGRWGDIAPFLGSVGEPVPIEIRRVRDGPIRELSVTPRWIQPREMFWRAIDRDAKLIDREEFQIAYVRTRSHAHRSYSDLVEGLLAGRLGEADGLVFDFRGGWGGQSMNFLRIFNNAYPELTFISRDGERRAWRVGWSRPIVGIADSGSRSSKDILAYVCKNRAGITLVGETTAGAVTGGSGFVLSDGSLLYLGVFDFRVDGKRLEGKGTQPDVAVDRNLQYAAGDDPQVDAAIDVLVNQLKDANASTNE